MEQWLLQPDLPDQLGAAHHAGVAGGEPKMAALVIEAVVDRVPVTLAFLALAVAINLGPF